MPLVSRIFPLLSGTSIVYCIYFQPSNKRLKDVEICVPIVYGTIAFWLGRMASKCCFLQLLLMFLFINSELCWITRSQSHKRTVYVLDASNEELGAVIKHFVFQLHPSFNYPTRVVEQPPFGLSECGWGNLRLEYPFFFSMMMSVTGSWICYVILLLSYVILRIQCIEKNKVFSSHYLKLYPEDETRPQSTKKPVVVESYNEIFFPDAPE